MRIRRKKRELEVSTPRQETAPPGRPPDELVRLYLRAQNLEQMRQVDEAVELYEEAVAARFDAAGPYDRLIAIYLALGDPSSVRRVAEAALANVRTFDDKRGWYESVRTGAVDAERSLSDRRGAEF